MARRDFPETGVALPRLNTWPAWNLIKISERAGNKRFGVQQGATWYT
ncbi:MAG: hypothetical protein Q4D74_09035 [Comamonadaceae bacterium]|nr:hypothetical protein [Comamonadaceae bacterium]